MLQAAVGPNIRSSNWGKAKKPPKSQRGARGSSKGCLAGLEALPQTTPYPTKQALNNVEEVIAGVDKKSVVIASVCDLLAEGAPDAATRILRRDYPFAPGEVTARKYGPVQSTRVFARDGFIDRYTGTPLIFPPVLRVISAVLPSEFPFHPNWKTTVTHPAFWEAGATVDHLVPVTCGGADDESNWVTTSMARNSAKGNWTLEDLGWTLQPPGDVRRWDGMMRWFLEYTEAHPETATSGTVRQWRKAAELAIG